MECDSDLDYKDTEEEQKMYKRWRQLERSRTDAGISLDSNGFPVSHTQKKRKWTTTTDLKLLSGILKVGEPDDWYAIQEASGLKKRSVGALAARWDVMQRNVDNGRYKNHKVLGLMNAIRDGSAVDPQFIDIEDENKAAALHALMSLNNR